MSDTITAHEKSYLGALVKIKDLEDELTLAKKREEILREALLKISDPRKRDHKEPDDYTEKCCLMSIAFEALKKQTR